MAKIHIAMVGETTENIIHGVIQVGGSELYPIVSEKFKESSVVNIRSALPSVKLHRRINDRELVIDPFTDDSFFHIVGLIVDIVNSRRGKKDEEIWINITGGTNLMSAAAATGAMLTEVKAYYVTQSTKGESASIIELPFMMKSMKILENPKRKSIVKLLSQKGKMTNGKLSTMLNLNKKSISKHAKILETHGIINRERDGRNVFNALSDNGKVSVRLMGEENGI